MNFPLSALAMALLLSSCALPRPATDKNDNAAEQAAGSSAGATQQSAGARPAGRTRAEVHAEAVEAAKRHTSTMQEERDYFLK